MKVHGNRSAQQDAPPAGGSLAWVYLRLTTVSLLWGGTFISGRLVAADMPPATAGAIRFLLATSVLALALHSSQGLGVLRHVTRRQWIETFVLGASGVLVYNVCFFNALSYMPASRTSLFVALNPVVTLLLAVVFFGERVSLLRWAGVALAIIGVWTVVTQGDFSQLFVAFGPGELSMLAAVVAWAIYTLQGRRTLQGMSPLLATLLAAGWGTGLLALFALREVRTVVFSQVGWTTWAGLAYLGIMGTALAYVWYYGGVARIGATSTVMFNNLVPVFGVLLGWLVLGEPLSSSLVVGGALAITGVILVNRVAR